MSVIVKPFTFSNGVVADATEVNAVIDTIYNDHNGNINNANIAASAGIVFSKLDSATVMGLASAQSISGVKTMIAGGRLDFSTIADSLLLPSATPTTNRSLGVVSNIPTYYDGTAARSLLLAQVAQTITGAKTFSGADTLLLPTASPTTGSGSVGFANKQLEVYDGSAKQSFPPVSAFQMGLYNIAFAQGSDSSQLKITAANGSALGSTNPGYVRIRSSTAGTWRTFTVTSDVTMDLSGIDFGTDTKGDITGMILRVYVIDDNGTLIWGVGYQGGFYYIRNTQDTQTATSTTTPESIYTTANVATDNSPMRDVGYIIGTRTDSSNEFAITEYHPGESADGIWQPWIPTFSGFSVSPTAGGGGARFCQIGKTITVVLNYTNDGTSNNTISSFTAPIKAAQTSYTIDKVPVWAKDNGTEQTSPGTLSFASASTTINVFKAMSGLTWTNTGAKNFGRGIFTYEAYQP